jgi:hypothetical protein
MTYVKGQKTSSSSMASKHGAADAIGACQPGSAGTARCTTDSCRWSYFVSTTGDPLNPEPFATPMNLTPV